MAGNGTGDEPDHHDAERQRRVREDAEDRIDGKLLLPPERDQDQRQDHRHDDGADGDVDVEQKSEARPEQTAWASVSPK